MTNKPEFPSDWPETVWDDNQWHIAMLAHLDVWLNSLKPDNPGKSLQRHMAMTATEFIEWRATERVPKVARIYFTIFPEHLYSLDYV